MWLLFPLLEGSPQKNVKEYIEILDIQEEIEEPRRILCGPKLQLLSIINMEKGNLLFPFFYLSEF